MAGTVLPRRLRIGIIAASSRSPSAIVGSSKINLARTTRALRLRRFAELTPRRVSAHIAAKGGIRCGFE